MFVFINRKYLFYILIMYTIFLFFDNLELGNIQHYYCEQNLIQNIIYNIVSNIAYIKQTKYDTNKRYFTSNFSANYSRYIIMLRYNVIERLSVRYTYYHYIAGNENPTFSRKVYDHKDYKLMAGDLQSFILLFDI